MMNRHYGHTDYFNGREGGPSRDNARMPYRRPGSRGPLPAYPGVGNSLSRGGCGCGLSPASRDHIPAPDVTSPCSLPRALSDRRPEQGGCGCDAANRDQGRDGRREGGLGCGCNTHSADCGGHKLAEKIRAVDFALYEVILYLDVYPHSCDALETYHKLKDQREALHAEYERTYGPLTAFGNQSSTSWDWFDKPFPWEYNAE